MGRHRIVRTDFGNFIQVGKSRVSGRIIDIARGTGAGSSPGDSRSVVGFGSDQKIRDRRAGKRFKTSLPRFAGSGVVFVVIESRASIQSGGDKLEVICFFGFKSRSPSQLFKKC